MKHFNDDDHVMLAQGLAKTYEDNSVPVEAVRGIDLAIHRGEFAALVGPSGSGKTTFLNLISGLDRPSAGSVSLGGKDISRMGGAELSDFRRDRIGFIFQAYNLIPVLTVEENVEYVMLLQGVPKAERHARVAGILADVGLEGFGDRLPPKLSGGQQQRVAVARAIVGGPRLILADEPTGNLDSANGDDVMSLLSGLHDAGTTIVMVTHSPAYAQYAQRIVHLFDGHIVSENMEKQFHV